MDPTIILIVLGDVVLIAVATATAFLLPPDRPVGIPSTIVAVAVATFLGLTINPAFLLLLVGIVCAHLAAWSLRRFRMSRPRPRR